MNIGFIPARGGSKSIPLKNIKKFCGKPLIYWTVKALEESKNIDKIIIATDSVQIKATVNSFNFKKVVIYDRDIVNAQDTSTTESVMLEFINKNNFNDDDLFFLLQITTPYTQKKDIDQALELIKEQNADSLLSCSITKKFFWTKEGKPINYDYMKRPRRQEHDGLLMENGAIFINTIGNIKKFKNRLSGKIAIYIMEEFTGFEIDEPNDWIICEELMKKNILMKKK